MGVEFVFDQFNAYFEDHSLRPISSERVSTILPEIMEFSIFHRCNVSTLWYYENRDHILQNTKYYKISWFTKNLLTLFCPKNHTLLVSYLGIKGLQKKINNINDIIRINNIMSIDNIIDIMSIKNIFDIRSINNITSIMSSISKASVWHSRLYDWW